MVKHENKDGQILIVLLQVCEKWDLDLAGTLLMTISETEIGKRLCYLVSSSL